MQLKHKISSHFEHEGYPNGVSIESADIGIEQSIFFKGQVDKKCVEISTNGVDTKLNFSYYIGLDWLKEDEHAIYIEPKLNKDYPQTDYLKMLLTALTHPDVMNEVGDLLEIKFDAPFIAIQQQQDLLSPFLMIQFLSVVKSIVRKGIKKSYYKVDENLYGKVKGKVLIGKTIKHNVLKNKILQTYCSYEEFGINGLENRFIKKTLTFVRRYLFGMDKLLGDKKQVLLDMFSFIMPAFESVSEDVNIRDIGHTKFNPFYREYEEALRLAKLILQRFSYNLNNTEGTELVKTPPFWIDMSRLFELYVLGLLKDRFGNGIIYHFRTRGNEPDYLLKTEEYKMVIDAKYKLVYLEDRKMLDIRQVSGYARLKKVYAQLNIPEKEVIDCLIIFPNQDFGYENLTEANFKEEEIAEFVSFYKLGVKLPMQHQK